MEYKSYKFMVEIKKVPDIDGVYIEFHYNFRKEFGKRQIKVYTEFDGEHYYGSKYRIKK